MVKKTSIRKNPTSGLDEKKPPKLKQNWRRKLGTLVDKKPLNLVGTTEENRKIVDMLILLAPQGALRISRIHW